MADIFISHSSKDSKTAMKIVSYLEENGLTCWISSRDIPAGADWAANISAAINSAKVFLLLYSRNSSASEQVSRELGIVETKPNITIIPYRMDDAPLTGSFEYFLTYAHWISVDESKKDYKLDELCADIKSIPGITIRSTTPDGSDTAVFGPPTAPQPAAQKPAVSKKPVIIISAAAAVVLIGVGAVIFAVAGNSSPAPVTGPVPDTTVQTTTAAATSAATTPVTTADTTTASAASTAEVTEPELIEVTDAEVMITFSGHVCLGTYTGPINKNGKPHGTGEFSGSYSNDNNTGGTVYYKGGFDNGECSDKSAYVEQVWSDGKQCVLQCEYKNGSENGFGECTWKFPDSTDIVVYRGYWKNSLYNGQGTLTTTYENGTVEKFKGEFRNGVCDGFATFSIIYPEGSETSEYIYTGQFNEGTREGKGTDTLLYADGRKDVYEGMNQGGIHEGHGKMTCFFTDGTYYECEGEYSDGAPTDGTEYKYYNSKGKVIESGIWQNGEKVKNS
jgi:hypothetical protein